MVVKGLPIKNVSTMIKFKEVEVEYPKWWVLVLSIIILYLVFKGDQEMIDLIKNGIKALIK